MSATVKVKVKMYSIKYRKWNKEADTVEECYTTTKTRKLTQANIRSIEQSGDKYLATVEVIPFVNVYEISVADLAKYGKIVVEE